MHTVIQGKNFNVKQTGTKFYYWSPRALRWLPIAAARVVIQDPDYEQRVEVLEAEGLTRSDAQGVVEAQDLQRNPKPWVVVRNPGEDDESVIDSFVVPTLAQACMRANPGSDIMRRNSNGSLTTEF